MSQNAEQMVVLSIYLKSHKFKVCDIEMTEKKLNEFYDDMRTEQFIVIGPVSFFVNDYDHGEVRYA